MDSAGSVHFSPQHSITTDSNFWQINPSYSLPSTVVTVTITTTISNNQVMVNTAAVDKDIESDVIITGIIIRPVVGDYDGASKQLVLL